MNHQHPNQSVLRRFGVATALGALLGAGGLFTLLGAGSPVNALGYHQGDGQPQPPTPPIDQIDDLFPDDDPILDLPTFSIPTDDDGPIFEGPNITIPVVPDRRRPDLRRAVRHDPRDPHRSRRHIAPGRHGATR